MTNLKCRECSKAEGQETKISFRTKSRLSRIRDWLNNKLPFKLPQLPDELRWRFEKKDSHVKIIAACHHCGKLLCQEHTILIIDDAFIVDENKIRKLLPAWYNQYVQLNTSKQFRDLENRFFYYLANHCFLFKFLKQKAYHCKKCKQKHHSSAKRHFEDL
ncbi:MAG: hypothetical protein KME64_12280 [Scytonematopsis contorta HA4267-MV1]|jgi:hypothetical protein|nr:hypothetical protein [Scytonematopsis contorta HA4267-MV1]